MKVLATLPIRFTALLLLVFLPFLAIGSFAQTVEIKNRHLVTVYNHQHLKIAEKYFGPEEVLDAQVGSNFILVRLKHQPDRVMLFDRRFRFLMSKSLAEAKIKEKAPAKDTIGEIIVYNNRIMVHSNDGWTYIYDDKLNAISRFNQISLEMSSEN